MYARSPWKVRNDNSSCMLIEIDTLTMTEKIVDCVQICWSLWEAEPGITVANKCRHFLHSFMIHDILLAKFLRDCLVLNDGIRMLRNPSFIRLEVSRQDYFRLSSLNSTCRLFNVAAAHIDPTLPPKLFPSQVIDLLDGVFVSLTSLWFFLFCACLRINLSHQ